MHWSMILTEVKISKPTNLKCWAAEIQMPCCGIIIACKDQCRCISNLTAEFTSTRICHKDMMSWTKLVIHKTMSPPISKILVILEQWPLQIQMLQQCFIQYFRASDKMDPWSYSEVTPTPFWERDQEIQHSLLVNLSCLGVQQPHNGGQ